MVRRGVAVAAILLSALTMGLEFAHVLEWPQKQHYGPVLYARLQESLYVWFGNLGGIVYLLAVATTIALAVLARREPFRRHLLLAAAAEVIALITFFAIVRPVNSRFPVGPDTVVPAGWTALRDRWEVGHMIGFVLFLIAFLLLIAGRLPGTRGDRRAWLA